MIPGIEIIVSTHALKDTNVRLFPASKNRSRRIHKKLVKRFGGEFVKEPCAYQMGGRLVMHPTLYEQLKNTVAVKLRDDVDARTMSIFAGLSSTPAYSPVVNRMPVQDVIMKPESPFAGIVMRMPFGGAYREPGA